VSVVTDINGLGVYPDVLQFEKYSSDKLKFSVVVQNSLVYGKYVLTFVKDEHEKPGYAFYSDLLNLEVDIIPYDPLFNLQPIISVDDQCGNTVGNPITF
jgi:hypothetical protein